MWMLVIILMSTDVAIIKEFPTEKECKNAIENVEIYVSKEALREINNIYCDTKENVEKDYTEIEEIEFGSGSTTELSL